MNENYSELQQKAAISEIQKANKTGITCQTILLIIIALAYLLELIKGNRTVGYTILVLAMCIIPIVLARLAYANKPTDELLIMMIIGIGFAVLYTIVLFTANNNLVFTYALPMLLICMLFNNVRFVYIVGVAIILENVFDVGYEIVIRKNTSAENIVSYEIQVLLMIMCVVFFVMINRVYGLFSEIRTARLTLEKNKINGILDDILGISKEMSDNVAGNATATYCENTNVINELQIPMVALGINNAVIAATPDGILVADKGLSDKLKDCVVDQRPMYEKRFWGEYKVLDYCVQENGENSLTKHLCISPGKHISYQTHKHRTEMWTVIEGSGKIIIEGEIKPIGRGNTACITPGMKHAIKADTELHVIEIQIGEELTEEDIDRLEFDWEGI